MQKLIFFIFISLLLSFSLTACDAGAEDVEDITDALKKQNIIDDDFELVDQVREIYAGLFITRTLYYIYQNQDSDYIAITYEKNIESKNDYDFAVTIYEDVEPNSEIEYMDDTSSAEHYYIFINDDKSAWQNKYLLEDAHRYSVYEKHFLGLFKHYEFEEE